MTKEELLICEDLYRNKISEYSKDVYNKSLSNLSQELIDAAKMLRSIITFLGNEKSGISGKTSEQIGNRIRLHQIYNQGMLETEKLLLNGQYFKAAVCMKQEIEIFTLIRKIKKGILPDGKTPNISFSIPGMGKAYGVLNDIGHVSKSEFYSFLDLKEANQSNIVSPFPTLIKEMLKDSYKVYLWVLFEMTKESISLFHEMFPEENSIFIRDSLGPYGNKTV